MEALLWGLSKYGLIKMVCVLRRWVFIDSRAALFIKFKFNELNYNNHLSVLLKKASSMPASGPTLWSLSLFCKLLLTFCTSFLCIPSMAPCTCLKSSFLVKVRGLAFSFCTLMFCSCISCSNRVSCMLQLLMAISSREEVTSSCGWGKKDFMRAFDPSCRLSDLMCSANVCFKSTRLSLGSAILIGSACLSGWSTGLCG